MMKGTSGRSITFLALAASAGKSFDNNKRRLNSGAVLHKHTWLLQLITAHRIGRFSHCGHGTILNVTLLGFLQFHKTNLWYFAKTCKSTCLAILLTLSCQRIIVRYMSEQERKPLSMRLDLIFDFVSVQPCLPEVGFII